MEQNNGNGGGYDRSRGRGFERGRGDRGRGERGRGDFGRGDRGRGDRGRGDYGRSDTERARRPEQSYTPRGRGGYESRGRRDESQDSRPYKKPRFDDGASGSSRGGWSRGGPSRGASSPSIQQFSGGWSKPPGASSSGGHAASASGGDSLTMPPGFGRGKGRGRGRIGEVVHCRPAHLKEIKGKEKLPTSSLIANYYKASSTSNWKVFQYHTDFEPEIDDTRFKRAFVQSVRDDLGTFIFDGSSLFTIQRLGDSEEYVAHAKRKTDDADITIKFKLVKELSSNDPILLQIFNILLRKCFRHLKLHQFNRNYYDPELAQSIIQHNLEVWPGFTSSISRYQDDVLMQADLTSRILRTDSVLQQMTEIRQKNERGYHDDVVRSIVGCTVITRYNNRTYRIDDIAWDKSPLSTFSTKDGGEMQFKKYYTEHWNVPITVDNQPLLISRPRERDQSRGLQSEILLVPELTFMTGLSEATSKNFQIMRAIAGHTRINPDARVAKLNQIMNRIQTDNKCRAEMGNWNLNFDNNLIKLEGRILEEEKIIQKVLIGRKEVDQEYTYERHKSDWTFKLRNNRMYRSIAVNRWLLLAPRYSQHMSQKFLETLKLVCPPMGIGLKEPTIISLDNDSALTYVTAIKSQLDPSVQLVVCMLDKPSKDRYDAIKKCCCVERPVPSQVVTGNVMDVKKLKSAATKIGIQINCKLGGAPWTVKMPLGTTMVVGYDSYRDSSKRGTSAGALCCSLDKSMTKYYSRVCFQTGETEMIDGLVENLAAGLNSYKNINKEFPKRVVFYRDGVSEGQLRTIRDNELSRILDMFKEIGMPDVKFAFVVVSKKINTKLMEENNGRIENPTPGTVVDTVITRNEWYDFYLVSQSVNQGTVSPTHFNVIHDTSQLTPDHQQKLAYKLTHLYFNWPGTVRVPAPCVYAHKLSLLASQSLHAPHHENLADSLFFL